MKRILRQLGIFVLSFRRSGTSSLIKKIASEHDIIVIVAKAEQKEEFGKYAYSLSELHEASALIAAGHIDAGQSILGKIDQEMHDAGNETEENKELSAEDVAQWVIDNRFGQWEGGALSGSELYHEIISKIKSLSHKENISEIEILQREISLLKSAITFMKDKEDTEAVEFAEWTFKNNFRSAKDDDGIKWWKAGGTGPVYTTTELYKLFKDGK